MIGYKYIIQLGDIEKWQQLSKKWHGDIRTVQKPLPPIPEIPDPGLFQPKQKQLIFQSLDFSDTGYTLVTRL